MKVVSYLSASGNCLGIVDSAGHVLNLKELGVSPGDMIDFIVAGQPQHDHVVQLARNYQKWAACPHVDSISFLPPLPPLRTNLFCVGRNYRAHAEEGARTIGRDDGLPKIPELFMKAAGSLVGHRGSVELHSHLTSLVDYEVELAVVIGRTGRDIRVRDALSHVFGYTIANDISARDRQLAHGQWFKGKSYDTFCPMGPWIVTSDEFGSPAGHRISLRLNGEVRQGANTSDLLFSVPELISSLSEGLTLRCGDVILTGTPAGVIFGMPEPRTYLRSGDVLVAEIEGIGSLENVVGS